MLPRRHCLSEFGCPLCAKSGHSGCFWISLGGKGAQVRGVSPVKLPRRQFLHLAAGAAALPVLSRNASAQTYPTRSVRLIVGFPAGNASDIVTRLMAQSLSERLGQQFIVENRPGASGNIGTEVVVRAHRTATRCSWSVASTRSTRHCTIGSTSISSATLRRSRASCDIPTSWW